eukprot:gene4887-5527_t
MSMTKTRLFSRGNVLHRAKSRRERESVAKADWTRFLCCCIVGTESQKEKNQMKKKKQLKQSRIGNFFKKTQPQETGCVPKDNQLQNKCKLLLSSHKSSSDVIQKTPEVAPKHKSLVNRRPPKSRLPLKRDSVKERQEKNVICIDEDENGQEKVGDRREPMSFGLSCERKNPIRSKEDRNESFKDDTDSACLQNCHQGPIEDGYFKDNADIKGGTVSRVFTQIRPSNKSLTSSVSSKDNHVTARVKGGSMKMGNSLSGTSEAHDQSCHDSRLGKPSEESTCKTLCMPFDDDLMNRQKTSKLKLKRLDSSTKRVFRFASSGLSPMKKKQATDCDVAVKSCNNKDASLSMEAGLCRKYSADGDASNKSSKEFGRRNLFATETSGKSDLHAKGKHYAKFISKNSFDKEKTDDSKVKKLDGVCSRETTGCENRGCHGGSAEGNRDINGSQDEIKDFAKGVSKLEGDLGSFEGSMNDFSERNRDTASVEGSMTGISERNRDTDSLEGSMNDFSERNRDAASFGGSMKDISERNRDTGSLDKNSIIDNLGDISLTDFNDSFFDLSNCEDLEDKKDKILDNKDATKGRLSSSKEASKELENMDLLHQSLLDISFGEDFDAASLATGRRDDTTVKSVLVLEVTRQEYHDSATGTHMEKAVRLFDEETSTEALCYLRQDWETMDIFPGDSVFITGFKTCEQSSITLDNSSPMFLTLFPNTLLSSTTISMGITCQRRAVLSELFKTDGPNQAMFLGTFLHDLFDFAIDKKVFSVVELKRKASKLLENYDNLNTLYSLGASEVEFMEKVDEYATLLSKWGKKFLKDTPQTSDEIVDFKLGSSVNSDDVTRLSITEVVDIEENILCPSLGLKGKVDASVNVTVHRQPKVSKQNRQQQPASSAKYHIPFELKTGKMFSKLGSIEHRAQVILYTLMMSEKYEKTVEAGLLYYVKTGHLQGVPATRKEKRALLMKRNELVRFLSMENLRNKKLMPGLLKDEHSCKRCPLVTSCMVYHKNIEEGTSETSGIRQQFNELTGHLTKEESQYFLKWYHLIMLEAAETASSSSLKKMWTESSEQRQSSGACFSNMRIKAKVSEDERLKLYIFERKPSEAARDEATVRDCVISAGDRVVISEEQCKTFGITKGLVKTVSRSEISVLCTVEINTRSPISDTLFRIERDESLTSHNIPLGNLMKLFASQSEHDKKLRQLLVDLHSPRFNWFDVQTLLTTTDEDGTQQPLVLVNDSGKQTTITTKSQRRQIRSTFAGLNPDQKMAVEKCLTAQDYVMVLGMPGTGKTTTIACIVKGLVALGKTVLITSYTHSAVDNILLKVKEMNLDFLRLGKTNSIHQEILAFAVENATASIKTVIGLERFYEKKKIVGTTCLGVNHSLFLKKRFDYCIVDEASQITQPVCFGAIRCADVFVLVGDHYQLPPLVQSMQAKNAGMDVSLFRRLSEHHPSAVISLQHQYRMHRDIMTLANALIYDHRMQCGTEELEKKTLKIPGLHRVRQKMQLTQSQGHFIEGVLNPAQPVVYVDTDSVALHECETGNHISNQKEANLVAFIFRGLTVSGVQGREIGIISPYRRQLNLIRDTLNRCSAGSLADVEINTVDKYQGRDKSCIIVSFVRSNHAGNIGNLLKDWRRINVALTRAKHKLFLIGSRTTLSSSPVLKQLADVAHNNDWIIKVPVDILELSQ